MKPTLAQVALFLLLTSASFSVEKSIVLEELNAEPTVLTAEIGTEDHVTWWLPENPDSYVLPISGGIEVQASNTALLASLRERSPWNITTLPVLGARYGTQMIVVIVPWPHYGGLVVADRIGIRYTFPVDRKSATPCEVVVARTPSHSDNVAKTFRRWRSTAEGTGAIPRPRPLTEKLKALPNVERLWGAPHIYLWGPGHFSRHDVPRNKWRALAIALNEAPPDSVASRLMKLLSKDQITAVKELAKAEWPMRYLTTQVAKGLDDAIANPALTGLSPSAPSQDVVSTNRKVLAEAFRDFVNPPETWGDGLSLPLLESLDGAGIDRALLVLSDLYKDTVKPNVVARAEELGYLLGPYDSYHSIHSPDAHPDNTWQTAQFGSKPFMDGRVQNYDGTGHSGFKGRGYHFSPAAAWPFVQERVNEIRKHNPYSTWFIDCDATAECFDDYHPNHPATRLEDTKQRRHRLRWLETKHSVVVGSEGGSALFADVIHYGHGVHTPYIGHLDRRMRDRESPFFLGRHWPPDTPEQSFKPVPAPPTLVTPYFDPKVRIPLYQAVFGDELMATHHWSFDSLKFDDIEATRELLEILYMVPPMYHLNRETWPKRKDRIVEHHAFWSPIHKALASAPLSNFEVLTDSRLLQRTTFQATQGEVTLTVNFDTRGHLGYPSRSATVKGLNEVEENVYRSE